MANWYARYPGDYYRKTKRLSLLEHGAYALLMDEYYSTGEPLPANADDLHNICNARSDADCAAVEKVLNRYFTLENGCWHHKRIEEELKKVNEISDKRRKAANIRHQKNRKSNANAHANATPHADANAGADAMLTTTTTTIEEVGGGVREGAGADSTDAEADLWSEVIAAVGHKSGRIPGYWMPPAAVVHVNRWVRDLGLTPEQVVEAARLSRSQHPEPPNGPKALDRAMQNFAEALQAPPLEPTRPTATKGTRNDRDNAFRDSQRQLVQNLRDGSAQVRPVGRDPFAA